MQFLELDDNPMLMIFSYLDPFTLVWMNCVCEKFKQLYLNEMLWSGILASWNSRKCLFWHIHTLDTRRSIVLQYLKIFHMLKIGLREVGTRGMTISRALQAYHFDSPKKRKNGVFPRCPGNYDETLAVLNCYLPNHYIQERASYTRSCGCRWKVKGCMFEEIGYTSPDLYFLTLTRIMLSFIYQIDERKKQIDRESLEEQLSYVKFEYLARKIFSFILNNYHIDLGLEELVTSIEHRILLQSGAHLPTFIDHKPKLRDMEQLDEAQYYVWKNNVFVQSNWLGKIIFSFICPFCWTVYKKNGQPSAKAKRIQHFFTSPNHNLRNCFQGPWPVHSNAISHHFMQTRNCVIAITSKTVRGQKDNWLQYYPPPPPPPQNSQINGKRKR